MPKNVTVTNSERISQQENIIKFLVFTLAASRLNSKVYLFSLRQSRIILKITLEVPDHYNIFWGYVSVDSEG